MNLKMRGDYVLVKLAEAEMSTKGGILLTSNIVPPCEGVVVSVGEGKIDNYGKLIEHNIKEGDVVIFGQSSKNRPLKEDGVEYYVMQIDEIFGKRKES